MTPLETPSALAAWIYSKLRPRRYDQEQIERGDRGPDLNKPLESQVDPAAEISLHTAGGDADDRGENGERQAEQHRNAEPVDQARDHVAALVVGAEPIIFEVTAALEPLLLHHLLALLFCQHPGRLRRRRRRQVEIVGVVRIADRRPDDGAALFGNLLLQIGIAIVGGGFEIAAERGLGIIEDNRPIETAVIFDDERLVVGDEIGKQREHEKHEEDPERPIAPSVGLEVLPAAAVERRRRKRVTDRRHDLAERRLRRGLDRWGRGDRHQTSRASKSIRGSIHM